MEESPARIDSPKVLANLASSPDNSIVATPTNERIGKKPKYTNGPSPDALISSIGSGQPSPDTAPSSSVSSPESADDAAKVGSVVTVSERLRVADSLPTIISGIDNRELLVADHWDMLCPEENPKFPLIVLAKIGETFPIGNFFFAEVNGKKHVGRTVWVNDDQKTVRFNFFIETPAALLGNYSKQVRLLHLTSELTMAKSHTFRFCLQIDDDQVWCEGIGSDRALHEPSSQGDQGDCNCVALATCGEDQP